MVYLAAVCAAATLGLGWVLQQRIAAQVDLSDTLSIRMLRALMQNRVWWMGIAAMAIGQTLAGLALQLGPVTLVAPLLSAGLLFAFVIQAVANRRRAGAPEVFGAVLLCSAVGIFLAVADPHTSNRPATSPTITVSCGVLAAVVAALVLLAKRRGLVPESILIATAAGMLYGLQDASTRAAFVSLRHRGVAALAHSPWAYLLLAAAVIGVILSQSAFRAARLDYSLPPIAVAESIVGGLLGVILLGDRLSTTGPGLAVECLCVLAMITSAVLIGRSPVLAPVEEGSASSQSTTSRRSK
jgi:drug/metabolite transporter (DMT)-like permease